MANVASLTANGVTPVLTGAVNVLSANPFITVANNAGSNAISLQYLNAGLAALKQGSNVFPSGTVEFVAGSNVSLTGDTLNNTITIASSNAGGAIPYSAWLGANAYNAGDVVLYGNSTWLCIADAPALSPAPPINTTNWAPLGSVGNLAASNFQLSAASSLPTGSGSSWEGSKTYLRGDVVNYTDDTNSAVAPSSLGYQYMCVVPSITGSNTGPGGLSNASWNIQNRTWQTQGAQYLGTTVGSNSALISVTPSAPVIPHDGSNAGLSFGYNLPQFTVFNDGGGSGGGIGTFIGTTTLTYGPGSNLNSTDWVGLQLFDTAGETGTPNVPPKNQYSFSTYYPFPTHIPLSGAGETATSPTVECKIITCPQATFSSGSSSYAYTLAPIFTVSGGNDSSFSGTTPTMSMSGGFVFTPSANSINPPPSS